MRIQQFTNTTNIKTSLIIAAGTLAIGAVSAISAAPAGAVTFTTGSVGFGLSINGGSTSFAPSVTGTSGNSFQVNFNIAPVGADGSFSPTFSASTVATASTPATFVYDSGTAAAPIYKLNNNLVFNFNTAPSPTTLTIRSGALFQGDRPTSTTASFQAVNGTTQSFFTNGSDITNNNPLIFSFNDLNGSTIGRSFTVSASPTAAVPEPFTIIGSIVGGAAALRMRKKMSKSVED
jgi:hypothetical protein